ncbi:MAG: alpha/beta fold hydrolase [bacterium]
MQLERNGATIDYNTCGTGATTILLTHGYSGTQKMWDPQLKALAAAHQVITWDVIGHGASDSPTDPERYACSEVLADMAAILDAVNVDRAVIGGLSLGGYLSLAFHAAYPTRTQALILADTGPGYRNDEAREQWNKMARGRAKYFRLRGLDELDADDPAHGGTHRSAQGLALAAEHLLVQYDGHVMASLPTIDVPVLVIVGENDTPFVQPSQYMAGKIPGAELVTLPDAGHVANIDSPELFNKSVVGFLQNLA